MSTICEASAVRRPRDLDNDYAPAFRRVVEMHGDNWTLDIPPAVCDLYPEGAPELTVHPSNNDTGQVKAGLLLQGKRNVEIDGHRATLMVRGTPLAGRGRVGVLDAPMLPIVVQQCENVVIRNLSIDWKTPFAAQGTIVESAPNRIVVRVEGPGKWWAWNGTMYVEGEGWTLPVQRLLGVEPDTGEILRGTGDNFGNGFETNWTYEALDENRVAITGPLDVMPPEGKMVLFWLAASDTGGRRSPAVFLDRCKNVRIEDVTIHHAWGMGIIAQRCEDLDLRHCVVEPSGKRRFSLTADATHFVSCKGKLTIEGCRFQNQFDDCVNVHGNFMQVLRGLDSRHVLVRTGHPQHQGVVMVEQGDTVEWLDSGELTVKGTAEIVSATALNSETVELAVKGELPQDLQPGDLLENATWYPTVTLRNNTFRWNRARGVLLNGRGPISVEHCRFESAGSAALVETSPSWFESGPVREVAIRDNTFVNCTHAHGWGTAVIGVDLGLPGDCKRTSWFHDTIRIEGNRFDGLNAPIFAGKLVRKIVLRDNILPGGSDTSGAVQADMCGEIDTDLDLG